MQAENYFPMGWLDKPFRRQPYPDMTYGEALRTAEVVAWNIDSEDSRRLWEELVDVRTAMYQLNEDFPGRSKQLVEELNTLWRGKVTTLLKWFTTSEGTKQDERTARG